jgi:hypothetical protein
LSANVFYKTVSGRVDPISSGRTVLKIAWNGGRNGSGSIRNRSCGQILGVQHDDKINGKYSTKESAFESPAVAASVTIHRGHEVLVRVPSGEHSEAESKAI